MKMKRLDELEQYIVKNKVASIKELSDAFSVSINTIRRDIQTLENEGIIKKIYGGVESTKNTANNSEIISYKSRESANYEAKRKIARKAATLIDKNDIIFVDSGTTTSQLIEFLPTSFEFTLVTNSLDVISSIVRFPNISLIIVGSKLDRRTMSLIYPLNFDQLTNLNIDKAFMAATAVSIENGLTNFSSDEYLIKKNIVNSAKDIIVLADSSKINQSTLMTYCQLSDISTLITEKELSSEYVNYFKKNNLKYLISN